MAISVEQGRLILPRGSRWHWLPARVPDPFRSAALLAVIVIHAATIGGLLAYRVSPREQVAEFVIEASILPGALPRIAAWQPVLPEFPLPQLAVAHGNAITLPPPVAGPQVAAPSTRYVDAQAPPTLDVQAVGYLVPPAPRYPPASRRAREEGEVLVRVLIGVDGRPSEVRILRSSGHARLDEAAVEAVRAALFRPYVAAGRAQAAYVRVPVEFALRRS